jgi:hypothetical protein
MTGRQAEGYLVSRDVLRRIQRTSALFGDPVRRTSSR